MAQYIPVIYPNYIIDGPAHSALPLGHAGAIN